MAMVHVIEWIRVKHPVLYTRTLDGLNPYQTTPFTHALVAALKAKVLWPSDFDQVDSYGSDNNHAWFHLQPNLPLSLFLQPGQPRPNHLILVSPGKNPATGKKKGSSATKSYVSATFGLIFG
jgi:hypothetical protein